MSKGVSASGDATADFVGEVAGDLCCLAFGGKEGDGNAVGDRAFEVC